MFEAADQQIQAGKLQPMIIVLPQGDKSYWTNGIDNTPRYGDYMAYEVTAHIDAAFGTIRDRSARAIGGLSMGAWGALYQAFTHPDIFGVVGAHSPSLYPDDNTLNFVGTGAEFASKDPVSLARTAAKLGTLRIWIDVATNDPWVEATTGLHNTLAQRGIAHEWHVDPGRHESAYWAQRVPEYLQILRACPVRAIIGEDDRLSVPRLKDLGAAVPHRCAAQQHVEESLYCYCRRVAGASKLLVDRGVVAEAAGVGDVRVDSHPA